MALVSVESVSDQVRVVTLDNPSRLNSLSFALVSDLYAALDEVAADNRGRVVVLTGAGRAFCSGLELEHAGAPPGTEDLGRHRMGMRAMAYMGGIVPALRDIPAGHPPAGHRRHQGPRLRGRDVPVPRRRHPTGRSDGRVLRGGHQ
jgi:enoyl-CoA hydratase